MAESMTEESELEKHPIPAIDDFAEILGDESRWFDLGILLEVSARDLNEINLNYSNNGLRRCLIEMFITFQFRRVPVTWYNVYEALLRLDNEPLAEKVRERYILKTMRHYPESPPISDTSDDDRKGLEQGPSTSSVRAVSNVTGNHIVIDKFITEEFHRLMMFFNDAILGVRRGLEKWEVSVEDLQFILEDYCGLRPLPDEVANLERVFARLHPFYCFLNYRLLSFLVQQFLPDERLVQDELDEYAEKLNTFKDIPKVLDLMKMIKGKRDAPGGPRLVTLKVQELWGKVTLRKFERLARLVFYKLYQRMGHLKAVAGCICASWIVLGDVSDACLQLSHLVKSNDFMEAVGIMSLSVGDTVVFERSDFNDCDSFEEIILHSFKIGNTDAIQFLLETTYDCTTLISNEGIEADEQCSITLLKANALQHAIRNGHSLIVSHLLSSNTGWLENDSLYSSNVLAIDEPYHNIIRLLLQYSRCHNINLISLASEKAHVNIVSALTEYETDTEIPANDHSNTENKVTENVSHDQLQFTNDATIPDLGQFTAVSSSSDNDSGCVTSEEE